MKSIYITNIPQVGSYDLVTIEIYTNGASLSSSTNSLNYDDLSEEDKVKVDDFIQIMFNNLTA